MKRLLASLALLGAAAGMSAVQAAPVVLTFEGLQNLEPIGNFYNGGLGGFGSGPGPNLGVTFSGNTLAVIDADAGGTGNFGGEPTPDTIMFFLEDTFAILNYAAGFDTGFSFYYSAINQPGFISVYDDVNGTGNLLATLQLPLTPNNGAPDPSGAFSPLVPIGVAFNGIAKSIDFGGTVNQIGFDNITFGAADPCQGTTCIPEPGTLSLFGATLLGFLSLRRRKA